MGNVPNFSSLEKAAMNRENRNHLMDGRLVLISPYDPSAGFNVGHAMQRNKLIYSLADAALVVNADYEKGGTWTGAVEQLEKLHCVPVYVRSNGKTNKALEALQRKGAFPWPNPASSHDLVEALDVKLVYGKADLMKEELLSIASDLPGPDYQPIPAVAKTPAAPAGQPNVLAEELFAKVRELLQRLPGPCSDVEIASKLNVSKSQANEWLERAIQQGWAEKSGKPARYYFRVEKQPGLFGG